MKAELVEQAARIITEPQLLINVVSRRVEQLNNGRPPLIPTTPHMGNANIALKEIIAGKLVYHLESDTLQEQEIEE